MKKMISFVLVCISTIIFAGTVLAGVEPNEEEYKPPEPNVQQDIPEEVKKCVQENGPRLQFHKNEIYWPASPEWFRRNSILKKINRNYTKEPSWEILAKEAEDFDIEYPNATEEDLKIMPYLDAYWDDAKFGQKKSEDDDFYSVRSMVSVFHVNYFNYDYVVARYNMFYPYNTYSNGSGNKHWGDWESAVLYFAGTGPDCVLRAIKTMAHGHAIKDKDTGQNFVFIQDRKNDIDFDTDANGKKRPYIYVAKHAHGTYWTKNEHLVDRNFDSLAGYPHDGRMLDLTKKNTTIVLYEKVNVTDRSQGYEYDITSKLYPTPNWPTQYRLRWGGKAGDELGKPVAIKAEDNFAQEVLDPVVMQSRKQRGIANWWEIDNRVN